MSKSTVIMRMVMLLCGVLAYAATLGQAPPVRKAALTVSGTITDVQTNEPMPGVTVQVKGHNDFVTTNDKGFFTIQVPDSKSVLVFTYAGFVAKEMVVGNQTTLSVSLNPRLTGLNEIVVVGYGKQKRGEVTGAIASVKQEDFVK